MRCLLDQDGRVEIPPAIREGLRLAPGSELDVLEEAGRIVLAPAASRRPATLRTLMDLVQEHPVDEDFADDLEQIQNEQRPRVSPDIRT